MKIRSNPLVTFALLLLATTAFMSGCATTGLDRSVKTSNSINEVDREMRKMTAQIDVTAASLDFLVNAGNTELKKPFNIYSDNVDKLDAEGKLVIKRVGEMKARSKEYFGEWEKQGDTFTNAEIRELSEQRRIKLAELYDRVPAAGTGIKGSYHDYLTDLKEIQKYLSNDLTPKGIEGITPVANKSIQHLDALKMSLQPVIAALDDIKAELSAGKK